MGGLQLGVGLVLRVPGPIVGEAENLVRGGGLALRRRRRVHAVVARRRAILVDVVTQVQHGVDTLQRRDGAVGVDIAGRVERAGGDGQDHVLDRPLRQGPGAAHGGKTPVNVEAEPVVRSRLQSGGIDLHRPVLVRGRTEGDGAGAPQVGRGRDHHPAGDCSGRAVRIRSQAGPEDDPVLQRIAAGDTMAIGDVDGARLRRCRRRAGPAEAEEAQGPTSVDPHALILPDHFSGWPEQCDACSGPSSAG
jgi:hypothetical protein